MFHVHTLSLHWTIRTFVDLHCFCFFSFLYVFYCIRLLNTNSCVQRKVLVSSQYKTKKLTRFTVDLVEARLCTSKYATLFRTNINMPVLVQFVCFRQTRKILALKMATTGMYRYREQQPITVCRCCNCSFEFQLHT